MRRRSASSILPVVIIAMGVILILGAFLFYLNPFGEQAPTQPPSAAGVPYPEVPRVSPGDAMAAFDTGSAVFVDVRGEPFYAEHHIPGALSIAEGELDTKLDQLDPGQWIITYCT